MDENIYGLSEPEPDYDQLEQQLELYEKGRRLKLLVNSPEWEIVVQTLQDYRDKARDALIALPPGDPNVSQAHAAASATNDVFNYFQQDIANAVNAATKPSEELKAYIFGVRKSLDVKAAMGQIDRSLGV